MNVRLTAVFGRWLSELRDVRARARIQVRIDRFQLGLLGDVKYFDGIGEARIDYGPGYRIYFVRRGEDLIVLLCGGNKSSQERDIRAARSLAEELKNGG